MLGSNVVSDASAAQRPIVRKDIAPSRRGSFVCDQNELEAAILQYQAARSSCRANEVNAAYAEVCRLYPPLNFVRVWFRKYRYLYDTREDFIQDYLRIFCTALAAWKPRQQRRPSRYQGTGDWKNYFWGSLHHAYINLIKSDASGKRNLSCRCPICDGWCNPLSTHLLQNHSDLLWEQLAIYGQPVESLHGCPFCQSFKFSRPTSCDHSDTACCDECRRNIQEAGLRRHLLSMHSTYLFERFRDLYPAHVTLSPRPASIYATNEFGEEEDNSLYDSSPDTSRVAMLLSHSLTPIQCKIVGQVFNGALQIDYDAEMYNCDMETFRLELDDLKLKMSLCGMDG